MLTSILRCGRALSQIQILAETVHSIGGVMASNSAGFWVIMVNAQ